LQFYRIWRHRRFGGICRSHILVRRKVSTHLPNYTASQVKSRSRPCGIYGGQSGSGAVFTSRDSSVGISTGFELGGRGWIPGRGKKFLFSSQCPDRLWGPPSLLSNWYRGALSTAVKRPGHEADHSPLSCAEVKNGGAIPTLPSTSSWRSA
jgi:hypothetical protein